MSSITTAGMVLFLAMVLLIAMVLASPLVMALEHNSLTERERAEGWTLMFDGASTSGWRGYRAERVSEGWRVRDGALLLVGKDAGKPAGDLISIQQYSDFELQLEWRVEAGGNSGVFIRADESQRFIFMTAPEIQILDDAGHRDGSSPLTSAGSNYGLHGVPRGIASGPGIWNHIRVRVQGNSVTQWLNGRRVVEYELSSDDWRTRVAASKFSAWPAYGTLDAGHIGLQDHGDPVAFRNIKIRTLSGR